MMKKIISSIIAVVVAIMALSVNNTTTEASALTKTYKVGQTAKYRGLSLKVNNVNYLEPDEFDSIDSNKHYIVVNVTIKNTGRDNYDYNPFYFKMNVDGNNTDFDAISVSAEDVLESGTLDKGASVTGNLVAEIKRDASGAKLKLNVNPLNSKQNITFALN